MLMQEMGRCLLALLMTGGLMSDVVGQGLAEENLKYRSTDSDLYFLIDSDGDPSRTAQQLASDHGITLKDRASRIASLGELVFTAQLETAATGPLRNSSAAMKMLIKRLRQDPRVILADGIGEFQVAGTHSERSLEQQALGDPYSPLQHSHDTTRVTDSHRVALGDGVKVAVIDTGVDAEHADLVNQIQQHLNFVGPDQDSATIEFHATAVAGIIGAEANNGFGVVGVAPKSELFVLRACVETNPGSSRGKCSSVALARALDWAIVNEMQIVNMSVHGKDDELVSRLIRKAASQGIVVVAATDLKHGQLAFPAKLPDVIAVSDQESNSLVGLAAHSQRIFIAPGEEILTTLPNDTFDFVTGSSFAAAHVTGIIALILEKAPNLSPAEITVLLRDSVRVQNWGIIVDSCSALSLLGGDARCSSFR